MVKLLTLICFSAIVVGCASSSNPEINYKISRNYKKLKYKFIINEIHKKILSDTNKWPTLYASFNNVDYHFGEELRIQKVFQGSSDYLNGGTTVFALESGSEVELNFNITGLNGYNSNSKINFRVDFICGEKKCSLKGIEGSSANELFNKFKNKITKIEVSSNYGYKTANLLLNDPLKGYRKARLIPFLAARRQIWKGMPRELLMQYGLNLQSGRFSCGATSTCTSGYTNIKLNDSQVIKFDRNLESRHIFRTY